MKLQKQIKEELHTLIDSIDHEHIFNVLSEDVVPYIIEKPVQRTGGEKDGIQNSVLHYLSEEFCCNQYLF